MLNTRPAPLLAAAPIRQPSNSLVRAVTAQALSIARGYQHGSPEDIAAKAWPRDESVQHIIRAASAGATTTTAGWADTLVGTAVGAFVTGLVPQSAAARLMQAGISVSLAGYGRVTIPRASTNPEPVFVGEGAPIPVSQGVTTAATCGPPCKLALIESLGADLAEHSVEEAETIFGVLMKEAASVALDKAVLSTTAGSTLRPAGIFASPATPLTATAGGGQAAFVSDTQNLLTALTAAGGAARVLFFASPAKAAAISIYAPSFAFEVVVAPTLGNTVAAADPQAVASGFGADPQIDIAREATIHYEDTTPLHLTTGVQGSAVVATPARSMFQTYSLALRLILRCAWCVRAPGLVQFIPAVTW